jgi:GntR family transcriptional regulator, vanillate catabolism transcriptional regulator
MKTSSRSARRHDTLRAYEGLRRLLVHDQLPPGKRLPEVEWSHRLGTSRPAIREAFALLAHEELLARGDRGGFFVSKYDEKDLAKILQARMVVETGALRAMAAIELDQQLLDRMGEYCRLMSDLLDHESFLGLGEIDRKFHMALVELAQNEWLVKMHRRTPASQFVFPEELDLAALLEAGRQILRDHREVYEAICDRRFEDAVTALQRHLTIDPSLRFKF